jgi:hypothetical protein
VKQHTVDPQDSETSGSSVDDRLRTLGNKYLSQGGIKYLYRLFNESPIMQGNRLANLRIPAYVTDPSFGTSY